MYVEIIENGRVIASLCPTGPLCERDVWALALDVAREADGGTELWSLEEGGWECLGAWRGGCSYKNVTPPQTKLDDLV